MSGKTTIDFKGGDLTLVAGSMIGQAKPYVNVRDEMGRFIGTIDWPELKRLARFVERHERKLEALNG